MAPTALFTWVVAQASHFITVCKYCTMTAECSRVRFLVCRLKCDLPSPLSLSFPPFVTHNVHFAHGICLRIGRIEKKTMMMGGDVEQGEKWQMARVMMITVSSSFSALAFMSHSLCLRHPRGCAVSRARLFVAVPPGSLYASLSPPRFYPSTELQVLNTTSGQEACCALLRLQRGNGRW